jgi:hypothetical protein
MSNSIVYKSIYKDAEEESAAFKVFNEKCGSDLPLACDEKHEKEFIVQMQQNLRKLPFFSWAQTCIDLNFTQCFKVLLAIYPFSILELFHRNEMKLMLCNILNHRSNAIFTLLCNYFRSDMPISEEYVLLSSIRFDHAETLFNADSIRQFHEIFVQEDIKLKTDFNLSDLRFDPNKEEKENSRKHALVMLTCQAFKVWALESMELGEILPPASFDIELIEQLLKLFSECNLLSPLKLHSIYHYVLFATRSSNLYGVHFLLSRGWNQSRWQFSNATYSNKYVEWIETSSTKENKMHFKSVLLKQLFRRFYQSFDDSKKAEEDKMFATLDRKAFLSLSFRLALQDSILPFWPFSYFTMITFPGLLFAFPKMFVVPELQNELCELVQPLMLSHPRFEPLLTVQLISIFHEMIKITSDEETFKKEIFLILNGAIFKNQFLIFKEIVFRNLRHHSEFESKSKIDGQKHCFLWNISDCYENRCSCSDDICFKNVTLKKLLVNGEVDQKVFAYAKHTCLKLESDLRSAYSLLSLISSVALCKFVSNCPFQVSLACFDGIVTPLYCNEHNDEHAGSQEEIVSLNFLPPPLASIVVQYCYPFDGRELVQFVAKWHNCLLGGASWRSQVRSLPQLIEMKSSHFIHHFI